jgi:predicted nucleic acid-binding protein
MGYKPWRVFLDTSALLAGLISSKGAARGIMAAGEMGLVELLLSTDVLIEADRNIARKFPHLISDYRTFLRDLTPTLVADPSLVDIKAVIPWVGKDDAPILAAAIKSRADYLVTWNTRDFMSSKVPKDLSIKIRTPGEFVEDWTAYFKDWPV